MLICTHDIIRLSGRIIGHNWHNLQIQQTISQKMQDAF